MFFILIYIFVWTKQPTQAPPPRVGKPRKSINVFRLIIWKEYIVNLCFLYIYIYYIHDVGKWFSLFIAYSQISVLENCPDICLSNSSPFLIFVLYWRKRSCFIDAANTNTHASPWSLFGRSVAELRTKLNLQCVVCVLLFFYFIYNSVCLTSTMFSK